MERIVKQQCHISFVYGSWAIFLLGIIWFIVRGDIVRAGVWAFFIALFLWLYVRYFPSLSRLLGYGSVADRPASEIKPIRTKVTLYTGAGCPFCPLVRRRLEDLRTTMGFELEQKDVTLKPDLVLARGIRALPVVEIGESRWIGNGTSDELARFIAMSAAAHTDPRANLQRPDRPRR
ncbi:MAG TPA: glutaredoxin family protein [Bacteroidota bacterium]|nr:glutaredoxin family protein [Bacteroidota bacterium]